MIRKKHTLAQQERFEFGLIGIASSENDYRMIWLLNKHFGFRLVRTEDLEIIHIKLEEPQFFPQFEYMDDDTLLHYRMLGNKTENGFLIEEMSKVDYLLQVNGDYEKTFIDKLLKQLNAMDEISLAFSIDPSDLRSGRKLLI